MFQEFIAFNHIDNITYGKLPILVLPKFDLRRDFINNKILLLPEIGLKDINGEKLFVGDLIINPILQDELSLEKYLDDNIATYKREIVIYKLRDDYWYSGFLATDFLFSSFDLIQDELCERICNITDIMTHSELYKIGDKNFYANTIRLNFVRFMLKQYQMPDEVKQWNFQEYKIRKG